MLIATDLVEWQVKELVLVLKKYKRAISWIVLEIIGAPPGIIQIKFNYKKIVHTIAH